MLANIATIRNPSDSEKNGHLWTETEFYKIVEVMHSYVPRVGSCGPQVGLEIFEGLLPSYEQTGTDAADQRLHYLLRDLWGPLSKLQPIRNYRIYANDAARDEAQGRGGDTELSPKGEEAVRRFVVGLLEEVAKVENSRGGRELPVNFDAGRWWDVTKLTHAWASQHADNGNPFDSTLLDWSVVGPMLGSKAIIEKWMPEVFQLLPDWIASSYEHRYEADSPEMLAAADKLDSALTHEIPRLAGAFLDDMVDEASGGVGITS